MPEQVVNSSKKIYQYIILFLIIVSAGYSFYRYLVKEDFNIYSRVSCDASVENCFIIPCEDGIECESYPYKVVMKNSSSIPDCNAWAGECEELFCEEGEVDCQTLLCTEDNLVNYEPLAVCIKDGQ